MYQQQAPRSAIPKVIGILMIIFASLGLLGSLISVLGGGGNDAMFRDIPELKTWHTIEKLMGAVGLAIGGLHLYTGVRAVGYKTNAPGFAVVYSLVAMVVVILNAVLVFAWIKPIMEKAFAGMPGGEMVSGMFGPIVIFTTLIGLAWPILVMILMTRPTAKAACINQL